MALSAQGHVITYVNNISLVGHTQISATANDPVKTDGLLKPPSGFGMKEPEPISHMEGNKFMDIITG